MNKPSSLRCSSSGCKLPGIAPNILRDTSNPETKWCACADKSSIFPPRFNDADMNLFEGNSDTFFLDAWSNSAALKNRSVAASQDSSCLCASVSCAGSSARALHVTLTKSLLSLYVRQFGNCLKKSLEGWLAQTTIFPIAKASAVVVQTTSVVLGFKNTL